MSEHFGIVMLHELKCQKTEVTLHDRLAHDQLVPTAIPCVTITKVYHSILI